MGQQCMWDRGRFFRPCPCPPPSHSYRLCILVSLASKYGQILVSPLSLPPAASSGSRLALVVQRAGWPLAGSCFLTSVRFYVSLEMFLCASPGVDRRASLAALGYQLHRTGIFALFLSLGSGVWRLQPDC